MPIAGVDTAEVARQSRGGLSHRAQRDVFLRGRHRIVNWLQVGEDALSYLKTHFKWAMSQSGATSALDSSRFHQSLHSSNIYQNHR